MPIAVAEMPSMYDWNAEHGRDPGDERAQIDPNDGRERLEVQVQALGFEALVRTLDILLLVSDAKGVGESRAVGEELELDRTQRPGTIDVELVVHRGERKVGEDR